MTTNKADEVTSLTPDDAEYVRLNRARALMLKVCEMLDLDADEAMNVSANVLIAVAVHECVPRHEVLQAIGEMYDKRIELEMKNETFN